MPATAKAESVRNYEPKAPSRSPKRVLGPKALGHLLLISQTITRRLDWKAGNKDIKQNHMDVSAAGRALGCYATAPDPW